MSCLPCDAARRDAGDLLLAVVATRSIESDRVTALVSGMDGERSWRVALFLAGIASGLIDSFSEATGLSVVEITQILHSEMTGADHDH